MELEFGGRRFPVAAADFVIGSGPDAALRIDAPGVRSRHAVARVQTAGMVIVAPGEPGAEILVNGARAGLDPTPLMHGDKLGIGGLEIVVSDPARAGATRVLSAAPAPPASGASLVSLTDGREYRLDAVPFIIGRDAGSHLVIDSELVSRRHAEILAAPDGNSLVDLSSNGVLVNGRRITAPVVLRGNDLIKVGPAEFRYHPAETAQPKAGAGQRLSNTVVGMPAIRRPPPMPMEPAAPAAEPLAVLLVKRGQKKGERFPVRTPVVNIGRGEFNDVALPDTSLSASHAKLQLKEGVWVLTDLDSTNGTRVDGQAVSGELALSPGSELGLGEVLLVFEPRDKGITPVSKTRTSEATGREHLIPPYRFAGRKLLLAAVAVALALAAWVLLRS